MEQQENILLSATPNDLYKEQVISASSDSFDVKVPDLNQFQDEYEVPEERVEYLDQNSKEIVDKKNLNPYQIIKVIAQKNGINIKEPKKGCRKCGGRGWLGRSATTGEPFACGCIFPDSEKQKQYLQGLNINMNRNQRRVYKKQIRKQMKRKGK